MSNFLLGTISGLFISGTIVGCKYSIPYTNKCIKEAQLQNIPLNVVSYYGAFLTTFSISYGYGIMFVTSPIWLPIKLLSNSNNIKLEPVDIISLSK